MDYNEGLGLDGILQHSLLHVTGQSQGVLSLLMSFDGLRE